MEEVRAALALQMAWDIGPSTARLLIDSFRTPSGVFHAGRRGLGAVEGLARKRAESILSFKDWNRVDDILHFCKKQGIKMTWYGADDYPELLREIADPPTVLYYRGTLDRQDRYAIAVVGSRAATPYGRQVARSVSEGLAAMGFTIVSGMARGIDSIAHMGAIRRGGRTIAVLGSGIDVLYPPEARGLYEKICGAGAVISEFPPGTPPNRENFPRRNRTISGLSLGVIVVEASRGSGTIITARYALDQNREVFAVPGNITSANSRGTNELIKNGAKMLTRPDDVVRELGPLLKGFIKSEQRVAVEMSTEERRICDILSGEPVHIDDITREAGIPASRVLGILLGLELKSVVGQVEGKKFFLIQEEQRV